MAFDMYISCPDDLVSAIEEFGIVPFFKNSLLGFSRAGDPPMPLRLREAV